MKKAVMLFAEGFETVEALMVVDILRRGGVEVTMASITDEETVRSAQGIEGGMDAVLGEVDLLTYDAIILPGGMPGTLNLESNNAVQQAIDNAVNTNTPVCAICAAPSILGHKGILSGKQATCFPGFEQALDGAVLSSEYVVTDGNIITARGAGVSVDFGLEIVKLLKGAELADEIRKTIQSR